MRIPGETDAASTARHGWIERHALAGAVAGFDRAHELVPEDEWSIEDGVADPSLEEPVPVGSAQSHRRDAHQDLAVGRLWLGLVVQSQLARAVETKRLHDGWP